MWRDEEVYGRQMLQPLCAGSSNRINKSTKIHVAAVSTIFVSHPIQPYAVRACRSHCFRQSLAWRTTEFRWQDLMGVLLCMVFARSAAMAFNRLVDHKVDADNPRTAGDDTFPPGSCLSKRSLSSLCFQVSASLPPH